MSDNTSMQTRDETPGDALAPEIGNLMRAQPPVDVYENDDGYLIRADVPGVAEGDIDVRFDRGELVFEAKRGDPPEDDKATVLGTEFGPVLFRRAFRIPEAIDATQISAHLANGVLELTLPKTAEQRPRQIKVSAG